jgi:hypothetical protein
MAMLSIVGMLLTDAIVADTPSFDITHADSNRANYIHGVSKRSCEDCFISFCSGERTEEEGPLGTSIRKAI